MSTVLDQPHLTPRSTVRYRPIPTLTDSTRASRAKWKGHTSGVLPSTAPVRRKIHLHRGIIIGSTIIATMLFLVLIQMISAWLIIATDDWRYGRPRTFQIDAFVGHELGKTPSHFVAMNLHGRVYILEIPGGDASHTTMLVGPQLSGSQADLTPIILEFVPGKGKEKDMLVHFGAFEIRYINQGITFVQKNG